MMAGLGVVREEWYRPDSDEYELPNGMRVPAADVKKAKRELQDRIDAAKGYDPYNHKGSKWE